MTREAKIGLLVALAFILVIGILLSDHVTTATRPPTAPLADIEASIKGGMTAPGATGNATQTPPRLPEQVASNETLPYVHPQESDIVVGRGSMPQQPGTTEQQPVTEGPVASTDFVWSNPDVPVAEQPRQPQVQPTATDAQTLALQAAAERGGEALVPIGAGNLPPAPTPAADETQMAGVKEYKIQPGDSVSKITAKFLGRDNPANRAVIYSLNPKLKANPNQIIVGQICQVPASPAAAENLRPAAPQTTANPPAQTQRQERPQADRSANERPAAQRSTAASTKSYTVKSGDTLWSIAVKQLGSGAKHKDILKLNADKISSADEIVVGMKLKLPA